ncbi:Semaphorin-6D [Liparis tanakae]|uniref:Semaphorin-6D n=1 Tax=Liparis tanakae TaxID=230148 RepID=A0A4Z2FNN6_9TELE|nr:Semaphorin-6D [Liparis tanakae]
MDPVDQGYSTSVAKSYQFPGFQGLLQDNDTVRLGLDFQRLLRINHMLYIAARSKLTWRSKDVGKCTVRGKNSDECYNYVKVLVPRNDETLFACGTNAFNPTCRNYKMSSLQHVGDEVGGQARCPFESGQSNVGLFAGGDFYSATMTDFLASDAVLYRSLGAGSVLRTVKYDSKWLREPHFLHAIDYGNYVYFFLSEIAVEYTALGKVAGFDQDIEGDPAPAPPPPDGCHDDVLTTTRNQESAADSAYGEKVKHVDHQGAPLVV